jgi:hypothetical protein
VSEERAQPRHGDHREKHKEKFHLRPPNEVSGIANKIPPRFSFVLFPHADALLAMWERVRFPPPPLFIGKMGCDQAKKWPSENGSENKSANVHFRLLMCAIVFDCRAANDPAMMPHRRGLHALRPRALCD